MVSLACAGLALDARADGRLLRERLSGLRVAAHRGGYVFADSNTIERFEAALRDGADIVETDLQVSSDGVPFLLHDADLGRVSNCKGLVSAQPAVSIERCRLNGLSHGPERFEAALAWARGRVVIDAEFKSLAVVQPAIELVRRYDAYEWVYFQVRDGWSYYREARAFDAYVALEATPAGDDSEGKLSELLALDDPRLVIIQLHPKLLSDDNLRKIRESGRLASIDAWRLASERRWSFWPWRRTAACDEVFARGVGIAISNSPRPCAKQRDALRTDAEAALVR
jgi:glycerophosphoryl diester phosphodiesterase